MEMRFLECTAAPCAFRFPATWHGHEPPRCPRCGSPTRVIAQAPEKTLLGGNLTPIHYPLHGLLDNLRSGFNVGSIFRTADACGISHLHLCGITPLPTHPQVQKTSLGAENAVSWSYAPNSVALAQSLKNEGFLLWGVETTPTACSLFEVEPHLTQQPLVLAFGNEVAGLDPGLLELCDLTLWIPMQGYKRSLNVAVTFGITVYFLRYLLEKSVIDDGRRFR